MIYLDSSALVKLLVEEPESSPLAAWLGLHGRVPLITSAISAVEVVRAARRLDERVVPAARAVLRGLDLLAVDDEVIARAADVGGVHLRSLDAIHLASALSLPAEVVFVAYDPRLLTAAGEMGLATATPAA